MRFSAPDRPRILHLASNRTHICTIQTNRTRIQTSPTRIQTNPYPYPDEPDDADQVPDQCRAPGPHTDLPPDPFPDWYEIHRRA